MMKRSKERFATLKQLTENFDETDRDLREILTGEVISVQEAVAEIVKFWWEKHVVADETSSLKSKKIYDAFANPGLTGWHGISFEVFKEVIKEIVPPEKIVTLAAATKSGRPSRADFTIMGVKLLP